MGSLKLFWEFLRNNKWVMVLLGLVASFAAGFFSRPERVEVKTEVVEKIKYQDRIEIQTKVEEKVVYVKQEAEEKIRIVYRETKPDGTKIEREEEHDRRDTRIDSDTSRVQTDKVIRDLTAERDTLKRKVESPVLPSFMVGVGVGYDRSPSWLRIPTAPNLSIGLEAKARIPKTPIWLGGTIYSTGFVAGTVSVSF